MTPEEAKQKWEETIVSEYRKYQHSTHGLDVYEEGAFRSGFNTGIDNYQSALRKAIESRIKFLEDEIIDRKTELGTIGIRKYRAAIKENERFLKLLTTVTPEE